MSGVHSRLRPADVLAVGCAGLRSRPLRAALSAVGIAIGIAAMVAVVGISESSRAQLISRLDALGTNLLTVQPGDDLTGGQATLPATAPDAIGRVAGVLGASSTGVTDAAAYRNPLVDEANTNGLAVVSADLDLPETVGATVRSGRWLTAGLADEPVAVLGRVAAQRLGVRGPGVSVTVGDRPFTVLGVLDPVTLAPELDRSVLVGAGVAAATLGADGSPGTVYVRTDPDRVADVRVLLAATADPASPQEVEVSRPSDALEARAAAQTAFTALLLGLGAVALLVGGVGIANVMVISVLERRGEVGLRRALGATRGHIGAQFLTESLLLSLLGGLLGSGLGAAAVAGYALGQGWVVVVPVAGLVGGMVSALVVGVVAGSWPALRAARLSPTDALRSA